MRVDKSQDKILCAVFAVLPQIGQSSLKIIKFILFKTIGRCNQNVDINKGMGQSRYKMLAAVSSQKFVVVLKSENIKKGFFAKQTGDGGSTAP